jgi:hypothetical protein
MFCAPGLIFGGTEGVGSHYYVLQSRTRFRRYRGRLVLFSFLRCQTRFRRYRGRRVPFACFALPDLSLKVSRSLSPVCMFCAPRLVWGSNESVGYRFHVLRSRTRFGRYKGRLVQFSCFALPDSFSMVPRVPVPVCMFCALGLIFESTGVAESRFHVLRS